MPFLSATEPSDQSVSRLRVIGAGGGLAVGFLVLFGYAVGFKLAWRLAPGLPATHPLSALCVALLGFGLLTSVNSSAIVRLTARSAVLAAAAAAALRLLAPKMDSSLFNAMTPFDDIVVSQATAGVPISMGTNTACVLLAIAASEILRWKRCSSASQLVACCAIGLLFVAFVGYLDHVSTFYGELAPLTLIGSLMLAFSVLSATRHQGFIGPLVAQSEPGRLARFLLGSSTLVIILVGWTLARYTRVYDVDGEAGALLAYQTVAIIILSWILVTAATIRADVIDRRRHSAEALLQNVAQFDALTGLLSRNQLDIHRAAGGEARPEVCAAELFIDLDRFRAVNEAFGHSVGDEFLIEIGRRLRLVGQSHYVARLGGDEFAIYCTGATPEEAELIGSAVTSIIAMPFDIQGRIFRLTASVGVSHSDRAGNVDLRAAADSAMHIAKGRGGNQVVAFYNSMYEERRSLIELEQYLHAALEQDNEISLAYQPIVKVNDQSLIAVEALARWTHPELGPVPPNKFIQLAETTGLIVPLGLKLMAIAVAQASVWRDQHGDNAVRINLNISPLQLANGDVIGDLKRMVDRHHLTSKAFCIEVTEGALSDSRAIRSLEIARDMGFMAAMDDFGVGYSSLSQLPRLPVTTVKLDRSFTIGSTESPWGAAMLASIVQLAHGLKLTVVAEGVETRAQLALVTEAGCDAVQGYIYAKPMKAEELQLWLIDKARHQTADEH